MGNKSRYSAEMIAEMCRDYRGGMGMPTVAKKFQCNPSNILYYLNKNGIKLRSKTESAHFRYGTQWLVKEIAKLLDKGLTTAAIGRKIGKDYMRLWKFCKEHGIPIVKENKVSTEFQRAEAVRLYVEEKMGIYKTCKATGLCTDSVRWWLKKAGVTMRKLTDYRKPIDLELCKRLYSDEKMSLPQVSEATGLSSSTILLRFKESGVPIRGRKEAGFVRRKWNDEFSKIGHSRQYQMQMRHISQGLCMTCSEPLVPGFDVCAKHLLKAREKSIADGRRISNSKRERALRALGLVTEPIPFKGTALEFDCASSG